MSCWGLGTLLLLLPPERTVLSQPVKWHRSTRAWTVHCVKVHVYLHGFLHFSHHWKCPQLLLPVSLRTTVGPSVLSAISASLCSNWHSHSQSLCNAQQQTLTWSWTFSAKPCLMMGKTHQQNMNSSQFLEDRSDLFHVQFVSVPFVSLITLYRLKHV